MVIISLLLSPPAANLCRRAATSSRRTAVLCFARNSLSVQRRKFNVAICNLTNAYPSLDQRITGQHRWLSSALQDSDSDSDDSDISSSQKSNHHHHQYINHPCFPRLRSLRNVGVFAHVDAGKTTVTERMLALSGIVRNAGSVDGGDTVTDYLPAERERGITIQSAAVGFGWVVPIRSKEDTNNSSVGGERSVEINLIDTPGHVDFSVEVHRSVAVLDGAVLVIDAVAGVQAQTETVWRAIRNTDRTNNTNGSDSSARSTSSAAHGSHQHEPLPAIMYINKMDRDGADFRHAIETVEKKLKGSNPVPVQLPLYRVENDNGQTNQSTSNGKNNSTTSLGGDIVAGTLNQAPPHGEFIGLVDILHMRALIYPPGAEYLSIEDAIPTVVNLLTLEGDSSCQSLDAALDARRDLIARLADVDEVMEDLYLNAMEDEDDGSRCPILSNITTSQIQSSLQRMTLSRSIMPTMCGAALRGIGVEPVLDGVAEFLPCPLDRLPPQLSLCSESRTKQQTQQQDTRAQNVVMLGHPLHPSTLAYVFKVVHMKGRGGSGDGRVAFARVYSGALKARDTVRVISPSSIAMNEDAGKHKKNKHPTERVGGMLELSGGKFDNLPEGKCLSGDVCALVGLKGVVTGDTLLLTSASMDCLPGDQINGKKKKGKNGKSNDDHWKQYMEGVHLAGLTSPRPVLTLRIEATSSSEQSRLSAALALLTVEDPSLVVKETPTNTLISGLGELHMEVVLDRLRREFGLEVRTGKPAVAYRETVLFDGDGVETDGFVEYDRTVGGVQLQGAVRLRLSPSTMMNTELCVPPEDPLVTLSPETREFFNMDPLASTDETEHKYPPALRALLSGARGSLKRGRRGPYPLANLTCHILDVESEMTRPETLPGAMRAAAANAVTVLLETLNDDGRLVILEPKMTVEVSVPTNRVGDVLSDLTARRGAVDDVATGDDNTHAKSMVNAEVPLIEILGYANSLRRTCTTMKTSNQFS